MILFRDRFGSDVEKNSAKINQLNFFNLLAHKLGVIWTENPRVGGSIPPLGTILIVFQSVTRWVARGLSGFVSVASELRLHALDRAEFFPKADVQILGFEVRLRPILLKNSKILNRAKPLAF